MGKDQWRRLDPHDLLDWPLGAQLLTLMAAVTTLATLAYPMLLRDDLTAWRSAKQQHTALQQRLLQLQNTASDVARLAPLLPARGLGCRISEVRARALAHGLTPLIGETGEDTPHGGLTEASFQMMLTGAYADLWRFAADLASAETAVILDQLSLAQGPQRQVELQARLSCIRQPDEALPA